MHRQKEPRGQSILGADQDIVLLRITARAKEPSKCHGQSALNNFPIQAGWLETIPIAQMAASICSAVLYIPLQPRPVTPLQRLPHRAPAACRQCSSVEEISPNPPLLLVPALLPALVLEAGTSQNIWTPAGIWRGSSYCFIP